MTDDIKKLSHTFRMHWDVDHVPPRLLFWVDGALIQPSKLDMTIEPDADGVPTISVTVENRIDPLVEWVFQADKHRPAKLAHEEVRDALREHGLKELDG